MALLQLLHTDHWNSTAPGVLLLSPVLLNAFLLLRFLVFLLICLQCWVVCFACAHDDGGANRLDLHLH